MYFVDDEHKENFERFVKKYHCETDPEYKVACYIVAVPEIYRKFGGNAGRSTPFDWVIDGREEDKRSEAYGVLSSGYKKLVDLGMNLYNCSYDEFNLMDALGTWGDTIFNIYQQAVQIRINRHVPDLSQIDIDISNDPSYTAVYTYEGIEIKVKSPARPHEFGYAIDHPAFHGERFNHVTEAMTAIDGIKATG